MKKPDPLLFGKRIATVILICGTLMAVLSQAVADNTLATEAIQSESTPTEPASEVSQSFTPCRHEDKGYTPEVVDADTQPAIDFEELKLRLRKTKAIGFFTKLELKNKIEDLFDDIEVFHEQESESGIEQLEEHFNLLLMKLLVLLQDDDPGLHWDIFQARPTLWITLSDATSFFTLIGT